MLTRRTNARPASSDRGYVTAETAAVLPVLVVVLLLGAWVLASVSAQLRCVDAARVAAREAARGEQVAVAVAAARPVAPRGASVTVRRSGEQVEVVVTAQVRPFGSVLRVLPPTRVSARAVALVEDRPVGAG